MYVFFSATIFDQRNIFVDPNETADLWSPQTLLQLLILFPPPLFLLFGLKTNN